MCLLSHEEKNKIPRKPFFSEHIPKIRFLTKILTGSPALRALRATVSIMMRFLQGTLLVLVSLLAPHELEAICTRYTVYYAARCSVTRRQHTAPIAIGLDTWRREGEHASHTER